MGHHRVGGVARSVKMKKNEKQKIWALKAGMPTFHFRERPIVKENIH
jgi:hypothetical protein